MWTFDHPPTAAIQQRYGFAVTPGWLEHLQLSSVRFNDGGSGSFVSADGLVLTVITWLLVSCGNFRPSSATVSVVSRPHPAR